MTRQRQTYVTPTLLPATWLVAEREIRMRLRSKAFVWSSIILMLAVLASILIGGIVGANPSSTKVAAVGSAVAVAEDAGAFEVTEAATLDDAEAMVRDESVEAAIVPDESGDSATGVTVIGLDSEPSDVVAALSVQPGVEVLEPATRNPGLVYLVSFGFGFIFLMSAITFGQTIAQSVVEEKQTRIVEILMATVPVRALLAGKIVGNTILAMAQIVTIAILSGIALLATGQDILLAEVGPSIVWFIVFFVAGFILLAALFSATAALVSRQEDLATAVSPVTTLIFIPYFLVIFFNDNPVVLAIMSYVPFSAPVGMPMRVFLGVAQWWEPFVSLAVLIATTVAVIGIASRVYSNGLLRMGAPVKWREALKA